MKVFVTLIETDGNQRYIFATNRLRQNVGASELIFRTCTQVALEGAAAAGGGDCWRESTRERARRLVDPGCNHRIEDGAECEVVVATSGRAILLCRSAETARRVVRHVTGWAARRAPGLGVAGVTAACDLGAEAVHDVILGLARELPRIRGALPVPESRFLRSPIVADCTTSGLPASIWARPTGAEDPQAQSAVARAKFDWAAPALDRIRSQIAGGQQVPASIEAIEDLVGDIAWLAVVHADGNGLGRIFLDLDQRLGAVGSARNRAYLDGLRRFSLGLELCAEAAFSRALAAAASRVGGGIVPVVPLVLGGDDFTAVCAGQVALPLARTFLETFEAEAGRDDVDPVDDIVASVARQSFGTPRLAACAGVAVVKPHFPFHAAYDLAEALLGEAKTVKLVARDREGRDVPCSAIDFHLLAAGSGADLALLRGGPSARDRRERLWGGPYVVTPPAVLGDLADQPWLAARRLDRLDERVRAIVARDQEGRRPLPRAALHELRAALVEGKDVADARLQLLLPRYGERGLAALVETEPAGSTGVAVSPAASLFRRESAPEGGELFVTSYLDALDAAELEA